MLLARHILYDLLFHSDELLNPGAVFIIAAIVSFIASWIIFYIIDDPQINIEDSQKAKYTIITGSIMTVVFGGGACALISVFSALSWVGFIGIIFLFWLIASLF